MHSLSISFSGSVGRSFPFLSFLLSWASFFLLLCFSISRVLQMSCSVTLFEHSFIKWETHSDTLQDSTHGRAQVHLTAAGFLSLFLSFRSAQQKRDRERGEKRQKWLIDRTGTFKRRLHKHVHTHTYAGASSGYFWPCGPLRKRFFFFFFCELCKLGTFSAQCHFHHLKCCIVVWHTIMDMRIKQWLLNVVDTIHHMAKIIHFRSFCHDCQFHHVSNHHSLCGGDAI